jgi:EAL domain-containing protein (putative c-di-GMP-specific phosphodiesterase class I)
MHMKPDQPVSPRALARALDRGEFTLHYQPIVDVATCKVVAFEALLRWMHPAHGTLSPGVFIPLAEESKLIVELGRWVLDEALREAATWPIPWRIAVNISPVQFAHDDLLETVETLLARHRVRADRLELEITEGVLLDPSSRMLTMLRALRRAGVHAALDDFGTGYSNLSYLRVLPLDRIKIDQSFVRDLGHSRQDDRVVRATIALGRALGCAVTAEGVETMSQFRFLRAHGCTEAQGFMFGRPRPGPLRRVRGFAALAAALARETVVAESRPAIVHP